MKPRDYVAFGICLVGLLIASCAQAADMSAHIPSAHAAYVFETGVIWTIGGIALFSGIFVAGDWAFRRYAAWLEKRAKERRDAKERAVAARYGWSGQHDPKPFPVPTYSMRPFK